MKNVLPFAILILVANSCIITNTPGFYSGYSKMSTIDKERVIFLDTSYRICELANNNKIYAINGLQLSICLNNTEKSVVYFWSPNCHADKCYSLKLVQDFCTLNNYSLFVIAQYYDMPKMLTQNQYLSQFPMFSINEKYYKTQYCNKYYKLFIKDLLKYQEYSKNDIYSNFFLFERSKLVSCSIDI